MKCGNLLTNKYVLYIILVVAIMNVVGYIGVGDEEAILFFLSIGVLTTYFSKNMIVVLSVAIIATNILFANHAITEGLKTMKIAEKKKKKIKEGLENRKKKTKKNPDEEHDEDEKKDDDEKKEEFAQSNVPSSSPAPVTESEEDEAIGKRIDYASTLEQAYDNLQQMLGPDGINGLSKETKNLVFQQKSLMKNLTDMAPVLKTAKETLDTMTDHMPNMSQLHELMGSFSGMAKGFKKKGKDRPKRN